MLKPLANQVTIFFEYELFEDCCHSNTAFLFFRYFLKSYENDEKLLVLITKYLICEIFMVKDTNLLIKA